MQSMRRSRRSKAALLVASIPACGLGLFPLFSSQLCAGVIRHDVSDSQYTSLAADPKYASALAVKNNTSLLGSGVLISPKWALTAGHVAVQTLNSINIGGSEHDNGTSYNAVQAFSFWPGAYQDGQDLGFIRLDTPVTGTTPATRYFKTSDIDALGTFVGYGKTGNGVTGATTFDKKKRAFRNIIDADGSEITDENNVPWDSRMFAADFDDPPTGGSYTNDGFNSLGTNTANALEGIADELDSGSGGFVDASTRALLATITTLRFGVGPSPYGDGVGNGSYSDIFAGVRISPHNVLIDDTISHDWKNSGSSFGTASNWKLGTLANAPAAPGDGDIVGFNTPGAYTVNLGANTTNHMLLVRKGDVTLNLGGFTYNLNSTMYDGSVVVARYSDNNTLLTFNNGTVNTRDVTIGQLTGATGTVSLGPNTVMNVTGDVYVGGDINGTGGAGTFNVGGSTFTTATLNVTGAVKVRTGSQINYNNGTISVGTLNIEGGRVILATGGNKVLQTTNLTITSGGSLDLKNNDLIINYTTGNPDLVVRNLLKNQQIRSTGTTAFSTALGYGNNGSLGYTTFAGIPVDATTEIVKFTYLGDADLDGDVDAADLGRVGLNWLDTNATWIEGDFNYSGTVDVLDMYLFSLNWQMGVGAPLSVSFDDALQNLGLSVSFDSMTIPEPAGMGAIALLACALKRPRIRRSRGA